LVSQARGSRRRLREGQDVSTQTFCSIAKGSASELEYHLLLAKDLKLIKPQDHAEMSLKTPVLKISSILAILSLGAC
jgi:four helix bundle protein